MERRMRVIGALRRHRVRSAVGLAAVVLASSVGFGGVSAFQTAASEPVVADSYTATILQAGGDCPALGVFNTLGFVTTHAVTTTSTQATFRYELVGEGTGSGEYVHPTAVEISYSSANGILRSAYRKFTGIDTTALGANPRIRLTVTDDNGAQAPVDTAVTLRTQAEAFAGSGTTAAPFEVSTVEQLRYIECMPNERQYVLTGNLDLTGKGMVPIGVDRGARMRLRFDGDGYTISNLTIDLPGIEYVGLFARLEASSVSDLTLASPVVHGDRRVGALVGYTEERSAYSRITATNAAISGTQDRFGLLAGESRGDEWIDTVADGTLDITSTRSGERHAGGLIGWGVRNTVRNATVDVAITGTVPSASNIGGVMGRVEQVHVSDIDATSTISLTGNNVEQIGGIFGERLGESSVVDSARVSTDITLTATAGVGNFRAAKIGGVAGQTGNSTLADSVVRGTVEIVTAPADGIDVIEWIGGYVGRVVDDRPRLVRSWIDVDVSIGADPTDTKAAKLIGALGGEVTELVAVDVLVTGDVTVAGKAETTGGLIGEPKDDRISPRAMLRNVLWSGTRSVGTEMTGTRSVLWGRTGSVGDRYSSVAYSEGVLWNSTVNSETLTEPLVGAAATATQLSDETFMEAAGYDTDTVWCIRPDELPTLRVLDAQACAAPPTPTVPTTPLAPGATQAVETVTLTVTPPDSDPAITSYQYSVSDDTGETWTKWMTLSPTTAPATTTQTFTVSGLRWCKTYVFKVRASNSAGAGPESPASAPVTLTLPAPEPPTNLTGTASKGGVRLTWTAPPLASVPGTDSCTYATYAIRRSTNGGATWSSWVPTRSTATSFTVKGLSSSTTYVFQVRSVNATGSSDPSITSNPVRPLR